MISNDFPIPFSLPKNNRVSTASSVLQQVLDACPSLHRGTSARKISSSVSPLDLPSSPTLSEFFVSPNVGDLLAPLSIMGHIATSLGNAYPVFWIGRTMWPTPWLFAELGIHANTILIDPPDRASMLWAVDQCLRSGACIVLADGSGFSMGATRRIQLACESARSHCLLARPMDDLSSLSAAGIRWHISPTVSDNDLPAWTMTLLRYKSSAFFAGMDWPAWMIRTMRYSQPNTELSHVESNRLSAGSLALSAELVHRTAEAAARPCIATAAH